VISGMFLKDWAAKLEEFLVFNERAVLSDAKADPLSSSLLGRSAELGRSGGGWPVGVRKACECRPRASILQGAAS
jgi:hypothetical protein